MTDKTKLFGMEIDPLLWIHRFAPQLNASVALCVGATIDFLAGEKSRAPKLLQHIGLEWLHRVASKPRRLVRRYAPRRLDLPAAGLARMAAFVG